MRAVTAVSSVEIELMVEIGMMLYVCRDTDN